jgi:hypothetical protein
LQTANLSTSASTLFAPPPSRSEAAEPSPIRFRNLAEDEEEKLQAEVRKLGEAKVMKVRGASDLAS